MGRLQSAVLRYLRGEDGQGGRMKKYATPIAKEIEKRSPEELLGVLCKIYPPEMAREIFERLMKGMEKQNERN